jgi:hypothetical protein
LMLLAFIPALTPVVRFPTTALFFVATWLGAAEAHRTRGWRTIVLPVAAIAVALLVVLASATLLRGAQFAVSSVLQELGAQP